MWLTHDNVGHKAARLLNRRDNTKPPLTGPFNVKQCWSDRAAPDMLYRESMHTIGPQSDKYHERLSIAMRAVQAQFTNIAQIQPVDKRLLGGTNDARAKE